MRIALAALALATIAGCRHNRTEVVVVVSNAGVQVPGEVDSIEIIVTNPGGSPAPIVTQKTLVCNAVGGPPGCANFPLTMTLVPGPDRPNEPVLVLMNARHGNDLVQSDSSRFGFMTGVSARLDFAVSPKCAHTNCAAAQSACEPSGMCKPIMPVPFDGEPSLDQGVSGFDMGDGGFGDGGNKRDMTVPGSTCGGLFLDGLSGSYLVSTATTTFTPSIYTIEAWVHPNQGSKAAAIVSLGDVWSLGLDNTSPEPKLTFNAVLSDNSNVTAVGPSVPINRWSHVAMTWDNAANRVVLMVDGQGMQTVQYAANPKTTVLPFKIGSDLSGGNNGFSGEIDEVRISTAQRYASLPFAPPSRHVNDGVTYALWHLDEGPNGMPTDEARLDIGHLNGNAQLELGSCAPRRCGFITPRNGTAGSMLYTPAGSFTMEEWVRNGDWGPPASTMDITSFPDGAGYNFAAWAKGGQVGVTAACPTGTSTTSVPFAAVPLRNSIWSHVAVTFDSVNRQVQMFVDGVPGPKTAVTCGSLAMTGTLKLGYGSTLSPLSGSIDELRLSSGVRYTTAFTPSEDPLTADAQTIGLWHFDEGGSQIAFDVNGLHDIVLMGPAISIDSGCL